VHIFHNVFFCDSVHFTQVDACIGILQNSLQLMITDLTLYFSTYHQTCSVRVAPEGSTY